MALLQKLLQYTTPGAYVNEDTYGAVPQAISTHDTVYVMGTCSNTAFGENTPRFVSGYDDFINQAGSSPSAAAIKLFFGQKSGKGLFFINVKKRLQRSVLVTVATVGGYFHAYG